ncbi:hypothetical protein R3P38DRAFT_3220668 [Favolaschia claudopus]|uniref:Uncharacterized protein n=1 Tax=Favolaschia claudopus TaxID=2862362 RepID=A0AAW0A107_9AGAR
MKNRFQAVLQDAQEFRRIGRGGNGLRRGGCFSGAVGMILGNYYNSVGEAVSTIPKLKFPFVGPSLSSYIAPRRIAKVTRLALHRRSPRLSKSSDTA